MAVNRRIASLVAVVLAAGVVSLSATPASAAEAGASSRAASHELTTHASGDTARFGAGSTRPGWTHVRDTTAEPVVMLRNTGLSLARLVSDLKHKRYVEIDHRFPIATTVDGHSDAYARLTRGVYYLESGYHNGSFSAAQFGVLHVAGAVLNASLPRADTITIDKRYRVHAAAGLPNRRWFRLVDHAVVSVNVVAVAIDTGVPESTIKSFIAHPSLDKLDRISSHPVFRFAQASGATSVIYNPAALTAGRYMLITFPGSSLALKPGQARQTTIR